MTCVLVDLEGASCLAAAAAAAATAAAELTTECLVISKLSRASVESAVEELGMQNKGNMVKISPSYVAQRSPRQARW